jgi:hypothetical protein
MEEARAAAFLEFKELAERDDAFDEGEQRRYDELLAEVQRLDQACSDWHRIVPAKSGRRF